MSNKYLVAKNNCEFRYGFITDGTVILGMPNQVALQLNKLELMCQQYEYLKSQPQGQFVPMPTLDGFVRKSALHTKLPKVALPETPTIDAKVAESMAFMEELDAVEDTRELNEQIKKFAPLFDWIAADEFPEGDWTDPLDLPVLGDPLALTADHIVGLLGTQGL